MQDVIKKREKCYGAYFAIALHPTSSFSYQQSERGEQVSSGVEFVVTKLAYFFHLPALRTKKANELSLIQTRILWKLVSVVLVQSSEIRKSVRC